MRWELLYQIGADKYDIDDYLGITTNSTIRPLNEGSVSFSMKEEADWVFSREHLDTSLVFSDDCDYHSYSTFEEMRDSSGRC